MAKIKINKKEIEKMLIEQLGCDKVVWDKNGNAVVELDLDEIKKKTEIVKKEEHHHYHYDRWPTYVKPYTYAPNPNIRWTINTTGSGTSSNQKYLLYNSTGTVTSIV